MNELTWIVFELNKIQYSEVGDELNLRKLLEMKIWMKCGISIYIWNEVVNGSKLEFIWNGSSIWIYTLQWWSSK